MAVGRQRRRQGRVARFKLSGAAYLSSADGPDIALQANDLIRVE
jgi:hypothetical protein